MADFGTSRATEQEADWSRHFTESMFPLMNALPLIVFTASS